MFAFNWLVGFGFWIFYILCGLVFTIIYTKFLAPKTNMFIKGGMMKKDGLWYNEEKRVSNFDKFDVYIIVGATFIFWPMFLIVLCIIGLLFLVWKSAFKLLFYALKNIAGKIPEISIKNAKSD